MSAIPSSRVLHYTEGTYTAKIENLETYKGELERHLETLEGLRDRIKDFWDSKEVDGYVEDITKLIISVRNAQDNIDKAKMTFQEVVDKNKGLGSLIDIDLSDITGLVGSLGVQETPSGGSVQ